MMLQDGVDHINVYSKGETELGRFLSNFARAPIKTIDGPFESIEGYWYWLGCVHPNKDSLRKAYGFNAKSLGRDLGCSDWIDGEDFKNKIKAAIQIKLESNPVYLKELKNLKLPLKHYYVYKGKRVFAPKADWIIKFLETFKQEKIS